jgi:hypothetical protein
MTGAKAAAERKQRAELPPQGEAAEAELQEALAESGQELREALPQQPKAPPPQREALREEAGEAALQPQEALLQEAEATER